MGEGGGGGPLLLALATEVISLPDTIIVYFYIVTVIAMAKYISTFLILQRNKKHEISSTRSTLSGSNGGICDESKKPW